MRKLYLVGAVIGTVLPYAFLIAFVAEQGFNVGLFLQQVFINNPASMFTTDLLISSVVLWLFIFTAGRRLGMKNLWVYILLNLTVGLSLALPLFLYFWAGKERGAVTR